jgi:hypothetical protein
MTNPLHADNTFTVWTEVFGGPTGRRTMTLVEFAEKMAAIAADYGKPVSENVMTGGAHNGAKFTFSPNSTVAQTWTITGEGISVQAVRNAYRRTTRVNCSRCGGDGIYKWGACVNGVMQFQGICFRCWGDGREPVRASEPATCEGCGVEVTGTVRFCEDCTANEIAEIERAAREELLNTPAVLNDGTYTMVYADDAYFTFRIRTAKTGKFAGRRLVENLTGPANELDFNAFGFVNDGGTINVWKRFERGPLVNRAREIEAIARNDREALEAAGLRYAQESGRCRNCQKVLTVPASLARGFGPDCWEKVKGNYENDPGTSSNDNGNGLLGTEPETLSKRSRTYQDERRTTVFTSPNV